MDLEITRYFGLEGSLLFTVGYVFFEESSRIV